MPTSSTIEPHKPTRVRPSSDRKSTRLNSSHLVISYAVFCLKKKKNTPPFSSNSSSTLSIQLHTLSLPLMLPEHSISAPSTVSTPHTQPSDRIPTLLRHSSAITVFVCSAVTGQ